MIVFYGFTELETFTARKFYGNEIYKYNGLQALDLDAACRG